MEGTINGIDDLRREIALLNAVKDEQEAAIVAHFNSPGAIFKTVKSFFIPHGDDAKAGLFGGQDLVGLVSRFVLPFILNKTLFRGSNFITKALVGLVSQKASGFINEENITSLWDKIKSLIPKKKAPKKQNIDYGIPPLSESY